VEDPVIGLMQSNGRKPFKGNEIFEWQQDLELAQLTKNVRGKWLVQNAFLAQRPMLKGKLSITRGRLLQKVTYSLKAWITTKLLLMLWSWAPLELS
jgi:hypothetical protein